MNQVYFGFGEAVRLVRTIRNDGTFAGLSKGSQLARRGTIGYVREWGLFQQSKVVYQVHFPDTGRIVGCRQEELIPANAYWEAGQFQYGDKVLSRAALTTHGVVVAAEGAVGTITATGQGAQGDNFTVQFGDRYLQVPGRLLLNLESD